MHDSNNKHLYFVIANWKMYTTYRQSIQLFDEYMRAYDYENSNSVSIIVCPPVLALASLANKVVEPILLGSQTCSPFPHGPHTGQIDAPSLQELAIRFCVVGHAEQRREQYVNNDTISEQLRILLKHTISPILCIGESIVEKQADQTFAVLAQQLEPLFSLIEHFRPEVPLIIAYEPLWAIGSSHTPPLEELAIIVETLHDWCTQKAPYASWHILYGGSIDVSRAKTYLPIPHLNGFMIGKISTDVKLFFDIVGTCHTYIKT
ncbi:hypothetical protein J120_00280 [candidate division TM6 bacterium JCVI TM6SC1]|uniref:Triosephosphate isomerase n=1 Tax=candidate division TM6 bacterium JCVI TM6SC1 TaxID=1306947 RepID=A0A0D2GPT9_9BACT|nr:hypothetical protein J120_00280 [candidate division TM6 bacterium JCVI TM6SC1]